jgi:hypothetical protein
MQQAPTITNFRSTEGPVGTSVTITGINFDRVPASNTVTFNGITATVTAATATSPNRHLLYLIGFVPCIGPDTFSLGERANCSSRVARNAGWKFSR